MREPTDYYDEHAETEWERLDRSAKARLEFENTTDYLAAHLSDGGRVLDVGGGAGRYAVWLADRGHEVLLVDPSEGQRRLAREKAREHGVADLIDVQAGDVRDLPVADEAVDATCCLGGPLSHVTDPDERALAARELRRVTRPGGPVFVSVVGLLAAVQMTVKLAAEVPTDVEQLHDLLADGTYDREMIDARDPEDRHFTACHFFRRAELSSLLEGVGLAVEATVGLEGPASNFEDELAAAEPDHQEIVTDVVRELREDPAVVDLSNHLLAVCRRAG